MKIIDTLNSPKVLEWIHGCLVIFWALLWITAAFAGWLSSVVFVSHLSAAALLLASWSAWQGARAEKKVDDNNGD